jgi:hypothetical protein
MLYCRGLEAEATLLPHTLHVYTAELEFFKSLWGLGTEEE